MDPRIEAILARGRGQQLADAPKAEVKSGDEFMSNRILAAQPAKRSEIQRITALPIAQPLTDQEIEAINEMHVKQTALDDGFRLQRVQAEAIQIFSETGGLFAPIEVGGGKTLIALRCIGIAVENGLERVLLFVPPQVYSQLVNHDIAQARRWVSLGCSFFLMGGKSPDKRKQLAGGRRGCWVFPYSLLSRPDSYAILEAIRPELMIFDEAHALKNRGSARTKRILTYWRQYRPHVVALSGTMTSKSLNDYAHILMMCLREGAPVPLEATTVQEWAATLDSEQKQTEAFHGQKTGPGPLRPLIAWSNKHFPQTKLNFDVQGFRAAYQNRLLTAPGVVSSPADSLGVSLIIENMTAAMLSRPGGAQLVELIDRLEKEWLTPSGDEIEHAMLVWKWNSELTVGFYNSLIWPEVNDVATRLRITDDSAKELLLRSREYHSALQNYHKELRTWFRTRPHRPGLDTPMVVGNNMSRRGAQDVGNDLFKAWDNKQQKDFPERIERLSIPVRVCDFKLMQAIEWAKNHPAGGIIWYRHQEVGVWMQELLELAGVDSIHCPAGKPANVFLTSEGAAEACKGKILVCSIGAHGEGKNLQYLQDQLFLQLPVSEKSAEQAIGRTHRKGQQADEITVTTMINGTYDEMALAALLNDALYVRETMNSPRKILIATWNPMPIIYGSSVLIRAGAQAKMLNARQQLLLQERFENQQLERKKNE